MASHRPDLLLAHTGWVRELAHALTRDFHVAEDAAQQALLSGLSHAPEEENVLRRWLAVVVRNFVFERHRQNRRRLERESMAARKGECEDHSTVLVRAEAHQALVRAVLDLDEPYRTAILMRYFDQKPPRAIAAQLGVSVNTVRSRLARALEQLKRTLDQRYGSTHGWLGPLGSIAAQAQPLSGPLSLGTVMSTKFALAAGGCIALGFLAWSTFPRITSNGESATVAVAGQDQTVQPPAQPRNPHDSSRRVPESSATTQKSAAAPNTILYGRATDTAGRPLEIRPMLEREGEPTAWGAGSTDGDFAVAAIAPGPYEFAALCSGYVPYREQVEIPAGVEEVRRDIVFQKSGILSVRLVQTNGAPWNQEDTNAGALQPWIGRLAVVATRTPAPTAFPPFSNSIALLGEGTFELGRSSGISPRPAPEGMIGWLILKSPPPLFVSLCIGSAVLATAPIQPGQEDVAFTLDPAAVTKVLARVIVTVIDGETGGFLEGCSVGIDTTTHGGATATTNSQGRAEWDAPPFSGLLTIRAKERALVRLPVDLRPGEIHDFGTIRASKPIRVRGRIDVRAGISDHWQLHVHPEDSSAPWVAWEPRAVDSKGAFDLELPPGRYTAVGSSPVTGRATEAVRFEASPGELPEIVIPAPQATPVRISPRESSRGQRWSITDTEGRLLWAREIVRALPQRLLLPPGNYVLLNDRGRGGRLPFEVRTAKVQLEPPF
ncbi:MAG: sigma-70 family RNA polymerase sigma factor [Planctomycetes bacterium]|nr:sigma-70 family RNA polymerase sigma factor [Planctomycetota bacterium]